MLDVRQIARILGGDVTGRSSCNVPGPGHSPQDRSLAIRVTSGGFVVHSFAGDDWREAREYVLSRLGLGADWQPDKGALIAESDDRKRKKRLALEIWGDCIDPRGTLAEHYLREYRGLNMPDGVAFAVVRFHPCLYFDGKHLPGMVALLRDIESDEPVGIHRTFLDRYTGEKVERRMLGIAKGAAIKLDASSCALLTIGEGVETVLAAREAGFTPAWALGSSGAIRRFPILPHVRDLTILMETDATSRRDVKTCSRSYLERQRRVNIVEPKIGNDFNDCWRARG
jgi:putative DNA primase/helicase